MSADKERIAELEAANALYQADAERIWALMPELRNTDAHYELHEAVQHKIAELEQFVNLIAPLGVIECAGCRKPTPVIEEGVDHICQTCEIEGLKRKLTALQTRHAAYYGYDEETEELNKLLAKAKEEGYQECHDEWMKSCIAQKAKEEGRKEAESDIRRIWCL